MAAPSNASSARSPRYVELADRLQERWASLPPGRLVESEHQLAAEFGVNRLTAREAVRELERRMVVRRVMGRGTFTAYRLEYEVQLGGVASFRRSILDLGHEPETTVVDVHRRGRGEGREVVVERVSSVDGFRAVASTDSFPVRIAERFESGVVDNASLHSLMEDTGLQPRRSEVRVSVEMPAEPYAGRLEFSAAAAPTWRVRSTTVDLPTGDVVHRSEAWMRTDMFAVSVILRNAGAGGSPTSS